MLQGLTLTALAVALREVPLPAEVKALIVAAAGLAGFSSRQLPPAQQEQIGVRLGASGGAPVHVAVRP